ncbi:glutamate transport system substrate-binding protein [Propionibacterium cyclohexanicum]|uniref:Glutamate transport system substrate-binding protein n=1 Tax=Propionibacterium cyclohexanicum TaxID=64702 RepID=A0A1H9QS45_9ACTN|nr:glutamate ABC transporter substrate-binding protein [Propionibacterium cyclohexanicum]SER63055.1 glutamate transport system substrate-binding protein [Propionibacterium cyclohexanicum]
MFHHFTAATARAAAGAALAFVLVSSMSACSGTSGSSDATGSAQGRIAIGVKLDQPGTSLKVGNDLKGFDADVARYVAAKMGYQPSQIDFKEAVSAQRETMIESGQVKFVVGTYSITDSRKQRVDFAGPYFIAGQDLLVRSDDNSITGPDSLNGKKLCSVTGSTSAQTIKTKYATGVDLQEMDSYSKCVQALAGGQIDALTTDNVILAGYAAQSQYQGKLKLVNKPFTTEKYGIGLKKGDTATCTTLTEAISTMISSGEWQKSVDENLGKGGFTVDTSTNPPTPAANCGN